MKRYRVYIPAVTLCLLTLAQGDSQAAPRLSAEAATVIAHNLSRGLAALRPATSGMIPTILDTSAEKTEYSEADKTPDDATNVSLVSMVSNHPHPYWKITRPGHSRIQVDDTTGRIISYVNYDTADANNDAPSDVGIPKSRALQIAKSAMQVAGCSLDDMALEGVTDQEGHNPPIASMHEMVVAWLRTYKGIPYRAEWASVRLEAETGDVISVGVGLRSSDPTAVTENVSQAQAQAIAEAQLSAAGLPLPNLPLMQAKKEIVPFNSYWQSGDEAHHTLQTRAAWNYHFGVPENYFEVWVDTETGDVIGGYHMASLGGRAKGLTPRFGRQLKHSEVSPRKN